MATIRIMVFLRAGQRRSRRSIGARSDRVKPELEAVRVEHPREELEVAWLGKRDVGHEVAGRADEDDQQGEQVARRFAGGLQDQDQAGGDHREVEGDGRHGDQLIRVGQLAGGDQNLQRPQPAGEEVGDEEVEVVPEGGDREAQEVAQAVAGPDEADDRDVHQRLEDMQPDDRVVEDRRQRQDDDEAQRADDDRPIQEFAHDVPR
jgi:hypothetical protein